MSTLAEQPDLRRHYGRDAAPVVPGAFAFDLRLLRPGASALGLLPACETVSWRDGSEISASLALRRPQGGHRPESLPIREGHTALLRYRWQNAWLAAWELRLSQPAPDPLTGQVTVELADEFWPLRRDEREWSFRRTKKRGRGWWPGEVTEHVCRVLGVPTGPVVRGRHRIDRLHMHSTGLDCIRAAYRHERERTADRFQIRLRQRLTVAPYHRPDTLLVIADHVRGVVLTSEREDRPATVIKATGRVGKGHDARTVKTTVSHDQAAKLLGRREVTRRFGHVDSLHDLRAKATAALARELDVRRTAILEVPGVPWIGRGDGMRWDTTEPGYSGATRDLRDRSFVWVTDAEHVLTGESYTMSLAIDQQDPWSALRERQDRERRRRERDKDGDRSAA